MMQTHDQQQKARLEATKMQIHDHHDGSWNTQVQKKVRLSKGKQQTGMVV